MDYVGLVIVLAVAQYFWFAFQVAGLRQKLGIPPPDPGDDPALTRTIRVHANTGEMLIVYLPLLALCGYFLHGSLAAAIGVLWIPARFLYRAGYLRDVEGRIPGFLMGDAVIALLALGALYGIARSLLAG